MLGIASTPHDVFGQGLEGLAANMIDTMMDAGGVGIAAIQVGRAVRMFVAMDNNNIPVVFVNPVWEASDSAERVDVYEGCLSVPGVTEIVKRYDRVKCKAQNLKGTFFEVEAEGRYAQCIQHESEHLDGQIFLSHLSASKRNKIKAKAEKEYRIAAFDAAKASG